MTQNRFVEAVDSHTCGHPTRLITEGIPDLQGSSVREKQDYFANNHDSLRTSILYEPRGHAGMFAAVAVEPTETAADIGLLFLSIHKYIAMCGHGTIGAVTSLLETGLLPHTSPVTTLQIETPSGLVPVEALVQDGRVHGVSFTNVPCYVDRPPLTLTLDGVGEIAVDLAYGGEWYALVDGAQLGTSLSPSCLPELLKHGSTIKAALNQRSQDEGRQPPAVSGALIYDLSGGAGNASSIVVFSSTRYDRSPCGTGTSALTALLVERGALHRGDVLRNSSIIDTTFDARVEEILEHEGGGRRTVPRIHGNAYITGYNRLVIADDDPLAKGFLLNVD